MIMELLKVKFHFFGSNCSFIILQLSKYCFGITVTPKYRLHVKYVYLKFYFIQSFVCMTLFQNNLMTKSKIKREVILI